MNQRAGFERHTSICSVEMTACDLLKFGVHCGQQPIESVPIAAGKGCNQLGDLKRLRKNVYLTIVSS